MKITCDRAQLTTALGIIQKAVPGRPTHPILANILIQVKDNKLKMTGFDLDLMIQKSLDVEMEEEGEITLPGKLFGDIISKISSDTVYIEFTNGEENPMVRIESDNGKYKLRGTEADEYPDLSIKSEGNKITYPATLFADGLRRTLFATSHDESKQILQGLNINQTKDQIDFASTDGHRLALNSIEHEEDADLVETALTIPATALREIEKIILAEKAEEIQLLIADSRLFFYIGTYIVTCRKLEGSYPNYRQLIPNHFEKSILLNRKNLLSVVEQVSVLSDQKNTLVKFEIDIDNQDIMVSVNAKELGNAKASIQAEITSPDSMIVGFNIKYLTEGLKALESKEIKINLNGPTQPVIINPLNSISMTYLIMPVQIKD